jgi:hypothetical protein
MAYGTVNADVIQSSVSGVSLGAGNATVFKNRIINGDMRIDQRNAGASLTIAADGVYTLDRWGAGESQASKFSVQQNAGSVTPPTGYSNYLGATSLAATTVGSTDYFLIYQKIEGFNTADLAFGTANAKTVTLSFQVYSSLTGSFGGSLSNSAQNRSYPFSYTVSTANTWTSISVTIPGDTTGTWIGATNGTGMLVRFSLGSGTTYSGTANAWTGSSFIFAPTGSVNVISTNGATFYITGVQLEVGSSATGFEFRDYGNQLIQCQRYYEVQTASSYNVMAAYNSGGSFFTQGGVYAVQKRTTPTFVGSGTGFWVITGINSYSAYGTSTFGAYNITNSTYSLSQVRVAGNGTPSSGDYYIFEGTTTFTFSAEL